jgi:hypothetical protein
VAVAAIRALDVTPLTDTQPKGTLTMKRLIATRRRKVAAIVTLLALVAVGVGVAAWLVSGNGPGTAKTGSLIGPTISAPSWSGTTGLLLPGSVGDVEVSIQNQNSTALTITSFQANGSTITTDQGINCTGVNFTTPSGTVAVPQIVPANSTTAVRLVGAIGLIANAPGGCQNAVVTLGGSGVTVNFTS